jgi:hypothetical protein
LNASLILPLLLFIAAPPSKAPPILSLKEMHLYAAQTEDAPEAHKLVRVAHPRDWRGEVDKGGRSMRLVGPNGENELVIAAFLKPNELGPVLTRLKNAHTGSVPSPPQAIKVPGIDPKKGERATRFTITGAEAGEMVMIERGGAIVLFAAIVPAEVWPDLKPVLERCYPTVSVSDAE